MGVLALVLLAMAYGTLPLFPRYLSSSFALFQQVYLRLFIGFALSILFFNRKIRLDRIAHLPKKEWIILYVRAFIYYSLGVVLFTQALLSTKIANVAFIQAIPMTAVLGFALLREQVSVRKIFLVTVSFAGVLLVSVKDFSGAFVFGHGELLALLSIVFVALGLVSRRWHSAILNDAEIATIILGLAGAQIFIFSLVAGEGWPTGEWGAGIVAILLLGSLINVGVSFFSNYGFARVKAVLANNIVSLDPVVTLVLAYLIFREVPTIFEMAGGSLIILGAVAMNLKSK